MTDAHDKFAKAINTLAIAHLGAQSITDLKRLSGGASQETWSFKTHCEGRIEHLILRRAPGGETGNSSGTAIGLDVEAKLIQLAANANVAVPNVRYVATAEDGIGSGFIMDFVSGEALGAKIVRSDVFDKVRPQLAYQCGQALAGIHSVPMSSLPTIRYSPASQEIEHYQEIYKAHGHPHPVFDLAFKWLKDHTPTDDRVTLVHGDFRNGNIMFDPKEGLSAVLDWELSHIGDPMEDMGWICVNSWRFGGIDKPVGGFGSREEMFAGYEAAGGPRVDPERVKFWEVLGTLKWGIMCTTMYEAFKSGVDRSVERAAIGRRSSETEIDLLYLLAAD
jgi:aminoglycoside phosphotransferase (APT) family kinase protein